MRIASPSVVAAFLIAGAPQEEEPSLADELRALSADLVVLPEEARLTSLVPERQASVARSLLVQLRQLGFARIEQMLEAGSLEWTALTRERWTEFLETLHREMIERTSVKAMDEMRRRIESFVLALKQQVAERDTPERRTELRRDVQIVRGRFEEQLQSWLEGYKLPELPASQSELREELLLVEREAIERVHAELVTKPILDDLDARVAAELGE